MIKAMINKSDVELQVTGRFEEICAEYCLMGRLIAESFAKKDKKLAELFEKSVKEMTEWHLFSCTDEELDEKMDAAKEEREDDLTKLDESLEKLKKTLEGLKDATK